MVMNLLKVILLLLNVCFFVACDDKVSGEADTSKNSDKCRNNRDNDPNCEVHGLRNTPIIHDYPFVEYGDGQVVEFHWTQTLDWFLPHEDHRWGFDMDPYALFSEDAVFYGGDVYMSVSQGKNAMVNILVDCEAKDHFSLRRTDKKNEVVLTGKEACSKGKDGVIGMSLPAGEYAIYYDEEEKNRYLHIKSYSPDLNRIIYYVQFGDDCGVDEGCYSEETVINRFNKVMSQVVVGGNLESVDPADVGFDKGALKVDLSQNLTDVYNFGDVQSVLSPIVLKIKTDIYLNSEFGIRKQNQKLQSKQEELNDSGCAIFVFKENEQEWKKKIYDMKSECEREERRTFCSLSDDYTEVFCPEGISSDEFDEFLRVCSEWVGNKNFYESEEKRCSPIVSEYNRAKESFDNDLLKIKEKNLVLGINQMFVSWTFDGDGGGDIVLKNYSSFVSACKKTDGCEKSKEMVMEMKNSCTGEETTTLLKSVSSLKDGSFKASITGTQKGCKYTIYKEVPPHVPGVDGAAQLTLSNTKTDDDKTVIGGFVWGSRTVGEASLNTIVHEIGHSFGLTDLHIWEDDPTSPYNYKDYVDCDENSGCYVKYEFFAFDESNLMNYESPNGIRLRYRPLAVAKTLDGGLIYKNGSKDFEIERQWDCIRSSEKCFKN